MVVGGSVAGIVVEAAVVGSVVADVAGSVVDVVDIVSGGADAGSSRVVAVDAGGVVADVAGSVGAAQAEQTRSSTISKQLNRRKVVRFMSAHHKAVRHITRTVEGAWIRDGFAVHDQLT